MTHLSRASLGLAVRAAREAAGLTLNDLVGMTGLTQSTLSRSELGERDIAFTELLAIADAVKVDLEDLRTLAETFEREGAAEKHAAKQHARSQLAHDLNDLQRLAIETAVAARAMSR